MAALSEQIGWEASMQQAQQRAARGGKAILLDFSAAPH
jgi:hypothetical protein